MNLLPIERQVIVIAGGSSGIGRATALELARRGARVVVAARGERAVQDAVDEIQTAGGAALGVVADVTRPEQMEGLVDRAVERFGRIDTWVQAAGVSVYARLEQITPEEFERVVAVNLLGTVNGARAALPELKRRGGAFIAISSVEGICALPLQTAYAASKHGVVGFLSALRMELARDRIPVSVTNVMPSTINTPLFAHARTKLGVEPRGVPPIYPPEDVARAVAYAARRPVRDIVVGGAGRLLIAGRMVAPALVERILAPLGFQAQQSRRVKGADESDNLFTPTDDLGRSKGTQGNRPRSLYTLLATNPAATIGLGLGAAMLLALSNGGTIRARRGLFGRRGVLVARRRPA